MLTVGTDTYITVEEVGTYAADSPFYQSFLALSTEQKESMLRKAAMKIDLLPLIGRKHSVMQTMAFPRDYQTDVPENVKAAQALETLAYLDTESLKRQELQNQGVTSVSLGQVSESYGSAVQSGIFSAINSREAYLLLRKYLAGSAVIV
jgi:hypothetical protein